MIKWEKMMTVQQLVSLDDVICFAYCIMLMSLQRQDRLRNWSLTPCLKQRPRSTGMRIFVNEKKRAEKDEKERKFCVGSTDGK